MTNAQTEEVPLNYERQPKDEVPEQKPVWRDVTINITRSLWTMHGMAHRVLEILGLVGLQAKSLAERGPEDFAETSYARGLRDGARNAAPRNYGGVNGNGWATWVLGIVGVLIAASVLGLTSAMFTMSQKVASLEAKVDIILATRK